MKTKSNHFEIFKSGDEFRWRIKSSNGKIIATSGESFKRKSACKKLFSRIMLTTLELRDLTIS